MKQNAILLAISDRLATITSEKNVHLDKNRIDEIVVNLWAAGPSYFYILNFQNLELDYISEHAAQILGLKYPIAAKNIADHIHPDDLEYVIRAEDIAFNTFLHCLPDKDILQYKMSFCFRIRVADGNYHLFLHQAVILSTDENGRILKALNIQTDMSHISHTNNDKMFLTNISNPTERYEIDIRPHLSKEHKTSIFSKRELEIIRLIARGLHNAQIAKTLFLSLHTVKNHRKNILQKSGAKSSSELISRCIDEGLI